MSRLFTTTLLLLMLAGTLHAQPPFARPGGGGDAEEFSAGYAALFTCSAHFIMGRPLADIQRVELVDLADLELSAPEIDTRRRLVRAVDSQGRQAIAAHRKGLGCTLLPPTWTEADLARLPYIQLPPGEDRSTLPFPAGDKASVRVNRKQQALLDRAFDGSTYGEDTVTLAVLVVKDGKLVAEQYRPGFGVHTGYRTWSTAKSVTATLIGIAAHQGLLDVAAQTGIPEWGYFDDPRQQITWTHLLHMSSGLYSVGAATNALYFGGQDVVSAITHSHLEADPGTRWKYANADTLLLLHGLRHVLADDTRYLRFPYDELFARIGMQHSRFETDHRGHFIGSSQMYTTARDLARFGLLYLNDGVWEGERLLPKGWSEFVTTPAPALPRADGERGYGAQFWLLDRLPGVPAGTYTSAGNKGQYSTVIPTENMVIVRTGVDPLGKRWQHDAFIAEAVKQF